jgi:hypothetical protein
MHNGQVLSTGDVARICHCSINSAIRWMDSGDLRSFKVPLSRVRRTTPAWLMEFMRANNLPLEWLETELSNEQ